MTCSDLVGQHYPGAMGLSDGRAECQHRSRSLQTKSPKLTCLQEPRIRCESNKPLLNEKEVLWTLNHRLCETLKNILALPQAIGFHFSDMQCSVYLPLF